MNPPSLIQDSLSALQHSLAATQDSLSALRDSLSAPTSPFYQLSVLRLTAAIGGVLAMLGGLWFVFARLKERRQGFGPNSLKALGLVLFLPMLLVISVAVPDFQTETLAALLGTVAGYVLSHSKPDDSNAPTTSEPVTRQ